MVCLCCVAPYVAAAVLAVLAAVGGALSALFVRARRCWAAASESLARRVLRALRRAGPPESIAFIMDGNRRWARARGRPGYEGHPHGGDTLSNTLQWCLDAGVHTVTVYAFSTENFKRPQREVDEIFALAQQKVLQMLDDSELVQRHRVRVNVLGDLQRLPNELRRAFARAMRATRHFAGGPTLNICFSYTSREEMASAVSTAVKLCEEGRILPDDIDEHLLASCLYTGLVLDDNCFSELDSRTATVFKRAAFGFPDLVVRTSGEIRLSDFLLMQSSDAIVSFQPVLWPDLTAWHMVQIVLDYQAQRRALPTPPWRKQDSVRLTSEESLDPTPGPSSSFHEARVQSALKAVRQAYYASIDEFADDHMEADAETGKSRKQVSSVPVHQRASGSTCTGCAGSARRQSGLSEAEETFTSPLSGRAG